MQWRRLICLERNQDIRDPIYVQHILIHISIIKSIGSLYDDNLYDGSKHLPLIITRELVISSRIHSSIGLTTSSQQSSK